MEIDLEIISVLPLLSLVQILPPLPEKTTCKIKLEINPQFIETISIWS